jgi:peptidoglycan/xylan/chitin deacetylase (PgdA/CDA1 family)
MIFRNDDLAYGVDIEQYKEIQSIFEGFGVKEMYSVVAIGGNLYAGDPFTMANNDLERFLGTKLVYEDEKVDEFIKNSLAKGHTISLHGWQHTKIAKYSYKDQLDNISSAKKLLEDRYKVEIKYFVPPFNNYNSATQEACSKLGLKILGTSENQLERAVREDLKLPDNDFTWYHAWRFYQNGLTPEKLKDYLTKYDINNNSNLG